MIDKAISKINNEMTKETNNSYVQVVGGFLLQHLAKHPESAEKIMDSNKTIIKSLDEMRKTAEKKKVGNCAVLTDQEGFAVVLKYFGIEAPAQVPQAPPVHAAAAPPLDFSVNLDDLL